MGGQGGRWPGPAQRVSKKWMCGGPRRVGGQGRRWPGPAQRVSKEWMWGGGHNKKPFGRGFFGKKPWEPLIKSRLRALHTSCLHLFRHAAHLSLDKRQLACAQSVHPDEKSGGAICAQDLISASLDFPEGLWYNKAVTAKRTPRAGLVPGKALGVPREKTRGGGKTKEVFVTWQSYL